MVDYEDSIIKILISKVKNSGPLYVCVAVRPALNLFSPQESQIGYVNVFSIFLIVISTPKSIYHFYMKVILTTPDPPCPDPPAQHFAQFPQYELTPACPPPAGQSM